MKWLVTNCCGIGMGHASPRTSALYTHFSNKLISQTKSPLELLVANHRERTADEAQAEP